ncbi:MAG: PLP-dependent aspartate aminotransferase family protein [Anaerolineae bacterium]
MSKPMLNKLSIFTQAVHAGERGPRPDFTPVVTPIYNSVGYLYDSMDQLDAVFAAEREGYVYPRFGTPTNAALERAVATLEGGEAALSFASGMAAIHAALLATGLEAGQALRLGSGHALRLGSGYAVVAAQDVYGATYALLSNLFTGLGVAVRFVDIADLASVERAIVEEKPKAIFCEVISNPLLKVADVPAVAELAHAHGAEMIVDSTFATPYLTRPLTLGADYVVHSSTKYLGGHGDVLGGVVVTSAERRKRLWELIKMTGGNLGPNQAWLTMRGLKTLPLRMVQHCRNAAAVADWLAEHPRIAKVNYPGLPSHPQHPVATRLFRDDCYGGMISFEIAGANRAKVFRFMEALKLILPATTMGDVYSLALYPAHSSHRALSPEERAAIGIGEGLVRLSVGIEDVEDIIADLDQALEQTLRLGSGQVGM